MADAETTVAKGEPSNGSNVERSPEDSMKHKQMVWRRSWGSMEEEEAREKARQEKKAAAESKSWSKEMAKKLTGKGVQPQSQTGLPDAKKVTHHPQSRSFDQVTGDYQPQCNSYDMDPEKKGKTRKMANFIHKSKQWSSLCLDEVRNSFEAVSEAASSGMSTSNSGTAVQPKVSLRRSESATNPTQHARKKFIRSMSCRTLLEKSNKIISSVKKKEESVGICYNNEVYFAKDE